MYVLTKVLWLVGTPSTAIVLLLLIGLVLAGAGRVRPGLATGGTAALLILAIGLGPVGPLLLQPLENRFPQDSDDGGPVAGIIAIGGGIYTDVSAARRQLSLGEAGERYIALADLARRHPEATLVFSGGSGSLFGEETSEADAIRRGESFLGLPPGRLHYEDRSRTTWENARETRALLGGEPRGRWLLVTSARHMPRAVGAFRKAGIDVTPHPVDYLTTGSVNVLALQPAVAVGLGRFDDAVKEWLGLAYYRLSGRSDELFPSPRRP